MIVGIGTDIVQIERFEKDNLPQLANRILSRNEYNQFQKLPRSQQSRFCAKRYAVKEAFAKAVGTGIGAYVHLDEIETAHTDDGAPFILLSGQTKSFFEQKHPAARIHVSISDDCSALAFVVIESD